MNNLVKIREIIALNVPDTQADFGDKTPVFIKGGDNRQKNGLANRKPNWGVRTWHLMIGHVQMILVVASV